MFGITHEVLLYDPSRTYFESDPPFEDKRQFGYSRDKRPDCVQVVIALVVTSEGFPLVYEISGSSVSRLQPVPLSSDPLLTCRRDGGKFPP